jgi:hypothetical protein
MGSFLHKCLNLFRRVRTQDAVLCETITGTWPKGVSFAAVFIAADPFIWIAGGAGASHSFFIVNRGPILFSIMA